MAIHYYDEENIDIGSKISCEVVVNHTVQLTDEEKVAAKERAMKELVDQHKNKMLKKTPVITKPTVQATEVKPAGPAEQASLF
jgi:ribosomal protein S8E